MPRRVKIRVVGYPALRAKRPYPVVVFHIERNRSRLRVLLRHLQPEQEGREHEVDLRATARPTGMTAAFLRACGFDVVEGAEFAVDNVCGKLIAVEFAPAATGEMQVVTFLPAHKGKQNEPAK